MKLPILTAICAAHAALATVLGRRAACEDDNCARAVTGTRLGTTHIASASADCASFLLATYTSTVTPTVVTQTVISSTATTSTTTSTDVSLSTETDTALTTISATITDTIVVTATTTSLTDGPVMKRTVTSKSIPTYASACSNAAAYSSACSCFGVSPSTTTVYTTLATPTATTTVDTTSSAVETDTLTLSSTITTVTSSTALTTTTTSTITTVTATTLQSCQSPIVNPSFEESNSVAIGWSVTSTFSEQAIRHDPAGAQSGSNYLVYTDPFFPYALSQTVTVCPGLAYNLTFWVNCVDWDGFFNCDATYCVGSTCDTVANLPYGNWGAETLAFPGTTGGETEVGVSVSFAADVPCGCSETRVDSFSLVPVV